MKIIEKMIWTYVLVCFFYADADSGLKIDPKPAQNPILTNFQKNPIFFVNREKMTMKWFSRPMYIKVWRQVHSVQVSLVGRHGG